MLITIINAFEETLSMVLMAGILTVLFGLPLGFLLYGATNKQLFANKTLYYIFQLPLTLLNSTPYLIIVIFTVPFIQYLASHNMANTSATILSLTVASVPFFSLLTFEAIRKLPHELSETVKTLGATPWQAILQIYLPEILPALVQAMAKTLTQLISYSTIAGLFGAGGIGALMNEKCWDAFELKYLICCALLLILTSYCIQLSGKVVAKQIAKH